MKSKVKIKNESIEVLTSVDFILKFKSWFYFRINDVILYVM